MTTVASGRSTSSKDILINSSLAAVLATAVTIVLHELVHLLTGLGFGHPGTLYPFGVTHDGTMSAGTTAATAISAPIFSLVTGIVLTLGLPRPPRAGFWHLFLFWLAATSMMEGAGYLVITPFGAGDTAATIEALDLPGWTAYAAAMVGVALMFFCARLLAPHVSRLSGDDRGRAFALALHPWWIAMIINAALALLYVSTSSGDFSDGDKTAIIAAGMALTALAPMAFIYLKSVAGQARTEFELQSVPVAGIIANAAVIALNIGLLLPGVYIG